MVRSITSIILPRLAATALSIALAVWAAIGLLALAANEPIHSLAAVIEAGEQPKLEALDALREKAPPDRVLASCDTAALRALATVRLKEFDLAYELADPVRADRASLDAEAAIRKSLSCAPFDGTLWLRLAMLDTARHGATAQTVDFLKLSHWTTPSESWVVRPRVNFAARLFDAGVREIEAELRSDIRTVVNFDDSSNVADLFVAAPKSVQAIFGDWIALLPKDRKSNIVGSIERRGGKLADT